MKRVKQESDGRESDGQGQQQPEWAGQQAPEHIDTHDKLSSHEEQEDDKRSHPWPELSGPSPLLMNWSSGPYSRIHHSTWYAHPLTYLSGSSFLHNSMAYHLRRVVFVNRDGEIAYVLVALVLVMTYNLRFLAAMLSLIIHPIESCSIKSSPPCKFSTRDRKPMSDLRMQEALTQKERLVQAEDALRESEERFRSIWECAVDAMVLMTNAAYHQLYGYQPEEVIGKSFAIIFPEEQRVWAVEEYHKLFHHPEILPAFESLIRRKNGMERLVEARYHFTLQAGQRTGLVSIVRDITEHKKAQEALQRSQRRTQRLMESNIIGIVIVEGDTILEASDAFL